MSRIIVADRVYHRVASSQIPTWDDVWEEHGSEVKRIVEDFGSGDWYEDEIISRMEDRYEEAVYNVTQGFKGIRIWRVMDLPKNRNPMKLPHIGIYWSFEEDAAQAHWGGGGGRIKWTYEAVIDDLAVVDKAASVYAYTCPACGEDEMEVTLKKGMPLRVLSVGGRGKGYNAELEHEESDAAEEYEFDYRDPEFGKWMTT